MAEEKTQDARNLTQGLEADLRRTKEDLAKQKLDHDQMEVALRKNISSAGGQSTKEYEELNLLLEALRTCVAKRKEAEVQVQRALAEVARATHSTEESQSYDLNNREDFAQFLLDADIRLVRGLALQKWQRDGMRLPRRQEAESMMVGPFLALVTHQEMELWAKGPTNWEVQGPLDEWEKRVATADIVAVSHVWEAREHPDPHGYQLRKLAKVAEVDAWYFIDYVSLYQFKRSTKEQEESFRKAMNNMHVLYAHENTSTLRIESLTPTAELNMDLEVLVYHAPSGEVRPVPVRDLVQNTTAYRDRGWCIAEWQWSVTRTVAAKSFEIDQKESDIAGQAPMPPEVFVPLFQEKLQFTHRSDKGAVLKLQEKVFLEKAQKNTTLKFTRLSATECEVAIKALRHYPVLRRLEISQSDVGLVEPFLAALFQALRSKPTVSHLVLAENNLGDDDAMALVKAVPKDQPLTVSLEGNDFSGGALVLALVAKLCQGLTFVHPFVTCLSEGIEVEVQIDEDEASTVALPLRRLRGLSLAPLPGGDRICRALATGLVHLPLSRFSVDLGKEVTDEGCQALSSGLSKLRTLELLVLKLAKSKAGDDGCRSLATGISQLSELSSLSLDLSSTEVGSAGCRALANALSKLQKLEGLSLNLSSDSDSGRIGDDGLQALASEICQLRNLSSLSLDFSDNDIGDGYHHLTTGLSKLQLSSLSLKLGGNKGCVNIGKRLATALSNLQSLDHLCLDLSDIGLSDDACETLVGGFSQLSLQSLSLDFSESSVGDAACRLLAAELSPELRHLSLAFGCTNVSDLGCRALARALPSQLSSLSLDFELTSIWNGCQGIQEFAGEVSKLQQLNSLSLNLSCLRIGDAGWKALAASLSKLPLSSLSLELRNSCAGDEGLQALTAAFSELQQLSSLSLNLSDNEVGGYQALAQGLSQLKLSSLSLDLSENQAGDKCHKSLAIGISQLTALSSLSLDLSSTEVGSAGCRALANALSKLQKLESLALDLSGEGSKVTAADGRALGASIALLHLTTLELTLVGDLEVELGPKLREDFGRLPDVQIHFVGDGVDAQSHSLGEDSES